MIISFSLIIILEFHWLLPIYHLIMLLFLHFTHNHEPLFCFVLFLHTFYHIIFSSWCWRWWNIRCMKVCFVELPAYLLLLLFFHPEFHRSTSASKQKLGCTRLIVLGGHSCCLVPETTLPLMQILLFVFPKNLLWKNCFCFCVSVTIGDSGLCCACATSFKC